MTESHHGSARERFLAFRRKQKRAPVLATQIVKARGLDFAVHTSPPIDGAVPLLCINGGLQCNPRGFDIYKPGRGGVLDENYKLLPNIT